MTIGQLAKRAGVNVQTLRYYERRALLPAPPRTGSGYRQYPVESVRRIAFIKRAQDLGFTLDEVSELLAFRVDSRTNCETVEARAAGAIARIDAKMAELERMRTALGTLVDSCRTRRATSDCPILESLEDEA